ncbi:endonuclease/exonuclease/phosphatase family protein [Streptomyces xiamenensis]|uniref:endonuclease/exonuclease/phosphatase family protein n=1 Tax=Streptomyces xiamenensis TaxID=408015 RepID=UPI0036A499FA
MTVPEETGADTPTAKKTWRPLTWWLGEDAQGRSVWGRGRVLAALAVLTGGVLAFPGAVPNTPGRLGSLLESFLPWLGLVIVVLFGLAVLRRSATALVAVLLPVVAWASLFGGLVRSAQAGDVDLVVVQHNVSDENEDPAGSARALVDAGADLIALQELLPSALPVYQEELAARYPYHEVRGTVGIWSVHPLSDTRVVDIKPRDIEEYWSRGMRTVVHAPQGDFAAYVAHLPSVRLGGGGFASARRDESAERLARAIEAEEQGRVVLLGDLNGTVEDRGLAPLTSRLNVPESGFAFSFPASFPVARIDQVMARSATVSRVHTLPAVGSDHLPVVAQLRWQ